MASSGGAGLAPRIAAPANRLAPPRSMAHPNPRPYPKPITAGAAPLLGQGPGPNGMPTTAQLLAQNRAYLAHPSGGSPAPAASHPSAAPVQNSATTQQPAQTPAAPAPLPNPLDATYYANVAGHDFSTNNSINSLNLQGSQDKIALQTALAQLAHQQPLDQLHLEQAANARGGLYSSVYDQNLGNLNYQYAGRQAAAQNNYANQMATIASRIAALQAGEPIYNDEQAAAAGLRAQQQAQNDPTLGYGTGGLNTSPGAQGGSPPSAPPPSMAHPNPAPYPQLSAAIQAASAPLLGQGPGPNGMPTTQQLITQNNAHYLAPGVANPGYMLRPPANAPSNAVWAGSHAPAGYRGIGGGWYVKGR